MKNIFLKYKKIFIVLIVMVMIVICTVFMFKHHTKFNDEVKSKIESISIETYQNDLLDKYNDFLLTAKKGKSKDSFEELSEVISTQEGNIANSIEYINNLNYKFINNSLEEEIKNKEKKLTEYKKQLEDLQQLLDKVNVLPKKDIPGYFVLGQIVLNSKYQLDQKIQYEYNNEKVKIAFLTFDDGPTENTDDIIKILKENQVYGTFFVIGSRISLYEEEFSDLISSGNSIGMHSFSHDLNKVTKGNNLEEELKKYDKLLEEEYNYHTNLVRVPTGSSVLNEKQKEVLEKDGYYIIDWDIDSEDWQEPKKKVVYNNVVDNLRKDCEVILFHEKDVTVDVLQEVIDELEEEEYYILPIPEEYFMDYKFESLSIY